MNTAQVSIAPSFAQLKNDAMQTFEQLPVLMLVRKYHQYSKRLISHHCLYCYFIKFGKSTEKARLRLEGVISDPCEIASKKSMMMSSFAPVKYKNLILLFSTT